MLFYLIINCLTLCHTVKMPTHMQYVFLSNKQLTYIVSYCENLLTDLYIVSFLSNNQLTYIVSYHKNGTDLHYVISIYVHCVIL